MSIRTNILLRVYLAFGLILLFAGAVIVQLCRVQIIQGKKWKAMSSSTSIQNMTVEAARGNIFANDGSMLATSVPEYELHMDMLAGGIDDEHVFQDKVDSLANRLSQFFGDKSAREYSRMMRSARKDSSRYLLIRRKVTFQELKEVRKFPIFNMGKYKGGLVVIQQNKRILPFRSLAARTIGYKNDNAANSGKGVAVGLEGAYADYINGENGSRIMQRIAGGVWMPVNDDEEIAPKEGADIISTIDVNFQDVAQDALKKQLIKTGSDHGCVVLMEVATGEIRAIANYSRTKDGDYQERMNYAISESAEPGSTFKLASYMSLIDEGKIDTSSTVNAENGRYDVMNPRNGKVALKIHDAEDPGTIISAKRAFEESSNVAAAKFVYAGYHNNPQEFIDKLYSYHLNERNQLQISGEGAPRIKNTHSKDWNKIQSLYQIAYGYESKLTPLQMLTFYNSVANNGEMISPIFVKEIRRLGNTVERFQARVINPKVCSDKTLAKVRGMLEGVVQEGTGKLVIKNKLYTVAGKTGTAQIADGRKGYGDKTHHQASFCGYFPADKPKYSMIVVIHDPTIGLHLAAWVAGPVFREIADRVYSSDLDVSQAAPIQFVGNTQLPKTKAGNRKALQQVFTKLNIKPVYASTSSSVDTSNGLPYEEVKYQKGSVPDVIGMGLSDALYVLGNAGYKVAVRGSGAVAKQSVTGGSLIPKGSKITIRTAMMYLSDILDGLAFTELHGSADMEISTIVFDSRKVVPGSLFVAVRGTQVDGHDYIDQAVSMGAVAVICEDLPAHVTGEVDFFMVANTSVALGTVAANFYDNPSAKLKLVGVTGTNGKTTIATLLYKLFRDLGYKCGLLSTVENQINGEIVEATHTTPDPVVLNMLLNEMVDQGCDYCFMEVSSHAIVQHRIGDLRFTGAIFSNLTHDHLDYHKTFDSYLKAKKAFFDGLPKDAFALTNIDDKNGMVMLQNTAAHKKTYGLKNMADYKAKITENQFSGLLLNIDNEDVWFRLVGTFNAYNLMAVYATAMLLEQDKAKVLTSLSKLTGARGRFDYVIAPNGIIGIVDYAHSPDAVQNILSTVHDVRKGKEKVITVLGCGGDRDKTKRPIMAKVACEWSDKVIFTSDNPRSEDPAQIIKDMEVGVDPAFKRHTMSVVDRREAIKIACNLAQPGDIVVIAGKGHEKYQEIKGVRTHFDDKEELMEIFKQMS